MKQLNKKSLLLVFCLFVVALSVNSLVFAQTRALLEVGTGTPESCTEAAFDAVLVTAAANTEADVITFNCGGPATIVFNTTKVLNDDLTIDGNGAITFDGRFTTNTGVGVRLFRVDKDVTVNFIGLTFTGGNATVGYGQNGAAINTAGNVNISNSTFINNYGGRGSAIAIDKDPTPSNVPVVNVFRSAFINNIASDRGVFYLDAGELNIANSTLSGNTANTNGGSVIRTTNATGTVANFTNVTIVAPAGDVAAFSTSQALNLRNSIISSPSATICASGASGTIADGGGNVVFGGGTCAGLSPASTGDPMLAPLTTGGVPYYGLLDGSSAFNLVTNDAYLSGPSNPLFSAGAPITVDQNGAARPAGEGKDAGAIEGAETVVIPTDTPTDTPTDIPTETPTETPVTETPVPEVPLPGAFNLLSPENGTVVRDTAEVTAITWQLAEHADSYEFILIHLSNNVRLGEVVRTTIPAADCGATANVCTLAVDAALQSLLVEGVYSWTVEAGNTQGKTEAANAPYTFTVNTGGIELVINGGFEGKGSDGKPAEDPWSLKKGTKDKIKCNKPEKSKIFAFTGECAWMFKGFPGDKSKLVQKVDHTAVNATDTLTLTAAVKSKVVAGKLITLKIVYADPAAGANGDGRDKAIIELTGPTLNEEYEVFSVNLAVASTPSQVKVLLKGKAPSGKIFVDDVSLVSVPSVGGGSAIPLPLPLPLP